MNSESSLDVSLTRKRPGLDYYKSLSTCGSQSSLRTAIKSLINNRTALICYVLRSETLDLFRIIQFEVYLEVDAWLSSPIEPLYLQKLFGNDPGQLKQSQLVLPPVLQYAQETHVLGAGDPQVRGHR